MERLDPNQIEPFAHLSDCSIARHPSELGTIYPGDTLTDLRVEQFNYSSTGDTCLVSRATIKLSSHAGTHADQPSHFMREPRSLKFPNEHYNGEALVVDISHNFLKSDSRFIERKMLEQEIQKLIERGERIPPRILIKTICADEYPQSPSNDFISLGNGVAEYLSELGCCLVGMDTLSVDSADTTNLEASNHGLLYNHNIAILENLDLRNLSTGTGVLITFFDPMRDFIDARGVSEILFVPASAISE